MSAAVESRYRRRVGQVLRRLPGPRRLLWCGALGLALGGCGSASLAEHANDLRERIHALHRERAEQRQELVEARARLREVEHEIDEARWALQRLEDRFDVCRQPIDPGDCEGYSERFGYDGELGHCVPFVYGLCDGNDNNFETLDECEWSCIE